MSGEITVREDGVYRSGVKISDLGGPYRFSTNVIKIEQGFEDTASESVRLPFSALGENELREVYNNGTAGAGNPFMLSPKTFTPEQGSVEDRLNTLEKNLDQIIKLLQKREGEAA